MTGFAYINKFTNTLSRKKSKKNTSFDDEMNLFNSYKRLIVDTKASTSHSNSLFSLSLCLRICLLLYPI